MPHCSVASIDVLIVDDHSSARWAVREFLTETSDVVRTVGEAENGERALVQAQTLGPHVVLLDLVLPDMHGAEVTTKLKALSPAPAVLIRTGHACEWNILRSKRAGADGFLTKGDLDHLEEAIIRVACGQSAVFEDAVRQVWDGHLSFEELTDKEIDVLYQIAEGRIDKEIAVELDVSESAVHSRVRTIFDKFGTGSRAQAVAIAMRLGYLGGDRLTTILF